MVTFDPNLQDLMNNPDITVASAPPWAKGSLVIKRASFRAGETPEHLRGNEISSGTCAGETGTRVYKGREIPATAACVGESRGR